MPITEPAVGHGFALGLSFFHDKPQVVSYPGQPPRAIMPSITAVFGANRPINVPRRCCTTKRR